MDAVSYSRASSAYKLAEQAIVGLTTKADLTTSGILVPVGTTATRPTLGAGEAAIRFNTDLGGLEEWNGIGWFNVSADITAVTIKGTDTAANILAKTGMIAEDLWIASGTLDGYVYDGSTWINIGPLQGPQGTAGISAYQVALNNGFIGTEVQWLASLVGPQGIQGITGNGVTSIVKTNTVGLVDTYTITFTDTTTTTFDVANGLDGANGVDGQAIDHVSKTLGTGTSGTIDVYTVWGDVAETISLGTFNVYNGINGTGTVGSVVAGTNVIIDNTDQTSPIVGLGENVTVQGNTFNGISQLVKTGTDGKLPAIDGSQLTGIDALPSQDGFEGKYLKTNGTVATWEVSDVYTHPTNHSPSIITQDSNNRFVSDAEKTTWNNKLDKSGGTMTGAITAIRETQISLGVSSAIDLSLGNLFTKSVNSDTTFSVLNCLSAGTSNSFILELTNAGSFTITWFSGIKWAKGIAPVLTASGVDVLGFYSYDGGVTWKGLVLGNDMK